MRFGLSALLFSFLITVTAFGNNLFENKAAGVTVTKPETWVFLNAEDNLKNLENLKMEDQEYQ